MSPIIKMEEIKTIGWLNPLRDRLHFIGKEVTSFSFGFYVLQICSALLHPMGLSINIYVLEFFIVS